MTRQQDRLRQCPCQCDLLAQDIACRARAGVLAVLFALTLCGAPRPARAETDEPTVPVMAAPLTPTSSPDESPVSPPAQPPSSSGPSTGQTPASAVDEMPPGTLEKWRDEAYVATQHAIESVDEALAPANSRHIPVPPPRFRIGLGGTVIKRPDKTEFDEIFDLEGSVDLPNTRRQVDLILTKDDFTEVNTPLDEVTKLSAALRTNLKGFVDFEIGARAGYPPVAFAAFRWARAFGSGPWRFYPLAKLFIETDDGFGASTSLSLEHWDKEWLFRTTTSGKRLNHTDMTDWNEMLFFAHATQLMEPDRYMARVRGEDLGAAVGIRAEMGGASSRAVDFYEIGPVWKTPCRRDWIFVALQPLVRWDRAYGYHTDYGIRIRFDIVFRGPGRVIASGPRS